MEQKKELDLSFVNMVNKDYDEKLKKAKQPVSQKNLIEQETTNIVDMMDIENNIDKEQITEYIETASNYSCEEYEEEVKGEYYQSKREIEKELKKTAIKTVCGLAVAVAAITGTVNLLEKNTQAGRIRKEVQKQERQLEVNGNIYQEHDYSDEFRNVISSTSDNILVQQYQEAREALKEQYLQEGLLKEPNISEIVNYMEQQYEELNKGKGK